MVPAVAPCFLIAEAAIGGSTVCYWVFLIMVKNSGTGFCQGAGPVLGRFGLPAGLCSYGAWMRNGAGPVLGRFGLPGQWFATAETENWSRGVQMRAQQGRKVLQEGHFLRTPPRGIQDRTHPPPRARFCVACLPAVRPFASSPGHLQRECGQGAAAPSACARIGGLGRLPSAVQHLRGIRTAGRRKTHLPIPFVRKRLPHRHRPYGTGERRTISPRSLLPDRSGRFPLHAKSPPLPPVSNWNRRPGCVRISVGLPPSSRCLRPDLDTVLKS